PVYIEDGVMIENSTIGPNVSILGKSKIRHSMMRDTVIGAATAVTGCVLSNSMIGDHVTVEGVQGEISVGDHSEGRAAAKLARRPPMIANRMVFAMTLVPALVLAQQRSGSTTTPTDTKAQAKAPTKAAAKAPTKAGAKAPTKVDSKVGSSTQAPAKA